MLIFWFRVGLGLSVAKASNLMLSINMEQVKLSKVLTLNTGRGKCELKCKIQIKTEQLACIGTSDEGKGLPIHKSEAVILVLILLFKVSLYFTSFRKKVITYLSDLIV